MWAALFIPLLTLVAALVVVCAEDSTRYAHATIAALLLGAACVGDAGTLYAVTTSGPITLQL